jgi:hypothetical protein
MPKMKPLQEWVCDICGKLVDIDSGWVEWLSPLGGGPHSFRIEHNREQCHQHTDAPDRSDTHLHVFLGTEGLQFFLSMLDVGLLLDPSGDHMRTLPEMRSFVDTVRRLHIPYYEEARQYFSKVDADGQFSGQNEVSVFLPETCKAIIERYEWPSKYG